MELVPIDEEDELRQRCIAVDRLWFTTKQKMQEVDSALLKKIQQTVTPLDDRIACIECSLIHIQTALIHLTPSCSNQVEANARRKELQVTFKNSILVDDTKIFI